MRDYTSDECQNPKTVTSNSQFTVVTYNLLAQSLLKSNTVLYKKTPEEYLDWNYRKKSLLEEIVFEAEADIFCFQEVEDEAYCTWFQPKLEKEGYRGIFKKRTGLQKDGCALFFREGKFELLDSERVEFRRNGVSVLDRDNVGVVALLRPKGVTPSAPVCIATTHLLFNPKAGEIKIAQLAVIIAEIKRIVTKHSTLDQCPVILCGDFNLLPFSPLYNFLLNGSLDCTRHDATQLSGYSRRPRKRRVPMPLFPDTFPIDNSCSYQRSAQKTNSFKSHDEHCPTESGSEDSSPKKKRTKVCNAESTHLLGDSPEHLSEVGKQGTGVAACSKSSRSKVGSSSADLSGVVGREQTCHSPSASFSNNHAESLASQRKLEKSKLLDGGHDNRFITHDLKFNSVYPHGLSNTGLPCTVTTYHCDCFETVDYICYTPLNIGRPGRPVLRLVEHLALPSNRTLRELGPMPNVCYSSDHLFLSAVFRLENS